MKMKMRKPVISLLFLTVLAPIVLYTDTFGTFLTYSSKNELLEDVSTFQTFTGEVRPLNVLPQESTPKLKEPLGVVYSDKSAKSGLNYSDGILGKKAHVTRQLTEESTKVNLSILISSKQLTDENPIKQVTGVAHEAKTGKERNQEKAESVGSNGIQVGQNDTQHSVASNKMELKHPQRSTQPTRKDISRDQVNAKTEKPKEQVVPQDVRVCQLKDQIIQGKVYLSLTSTRNNAHFVRELRLRIKEVQRALGSATKDSELPKSAYEKSKAMEQALLKAKQIQDDCTAMTKKLRAMLQSAEEQLRVHKKQALFLSHLTAKTMPKGLHCLPLRLSTEYFMLNSSQQQFHNEDKLEDPNLYHYALFSDNVLATAVVINSTITHARDPSKHVFHIVTDRLNYAAMKMWFLANPLSKATIQVQNVEEFTWLNSSYSPVLKQLSSRSMIDYYFKNRHSESDSNMKFRNPKYLSIMNHLRFYLPEIFPKLDKVLFLDDDIVVQKDLTNLWSVDLKGKVIGVVETCGESFHRFDRYLNFSNPIISKSFDPRACGWAFGMNVFDLKEWRKQNITEVYHKWQNLNHDRQLWKLGTLPPGLITFWKQTHALDKSWHVLGLGYNPNVPHKEIEHAAVVHYNGNLKPWLEIGIPKFRNYWTKFVNYDQIYLRECNISP